MREENNLEKVKIRGEWWKVGYWKDKKILSCLPFSHKQVNTALNKLKSIFDSKWLLKNLKEKKRHPLVSFLLISGTSRLGLARLIRLGLDLENIYSIPGGKKLIKTLKNDRENFYPLREEVRIGAWLVEKRFKIKKLSQKGPDFLVESNNTKFLIEVKTLQETDFDKLLQHFILSFLSSAIMIRGFNVEIELKKNFERNLKFALGLSEQDKIPFLVKKIEPSINLLKGRIKNKKLQGTTKHFRYKVKRDPTTQSAIRHSFIQSPERRIKKRIEEAIGQFKAFNELPGIVMIDYSSCSLDKEALDSIKTFLNLKSKEFLQLEGLILYRKVFTNYEEQIKNKVILKETKLSNYASIKTFFNLIQKNFK